MKRITEFMVEYTALEAMAFLFLSLVTMGLAVPAVLGAI